MQITGKGIPVQKYFSKITQVQNINITRTHLTYYSYKTKFISIREFYVKVIKHEVLDMEASVLIFLNAFTVSFNSNFKIRTVKFN